MLLLHSKRDKNGQIKGSKIGQQLNFSAKKDQAIKRPILPQFAAIVTTNKRIRHFLIRVLWFRHSLDVLCFSTKNGNEKFLKLLLAGLEKWF